MRAYRIPMALGDQLGYYDIPFMRFYQTYTGQYRMLGRFSKPDQARIDRAAARRIARIERAIANIRASMEV